MVENRQKRHPKAAVAAMTALKASELVGHGVSETLEGLTHVWQRRTWPFYEENSYRSPKHGHKALGQSDPTASPELSVEGARIEAFNAERQSLHSIQRKAQKR